MRRRLLRGHQSRGREAASQETPDPFIKLVGHVAHETRVNRPEIVVDLGDPTDPPEEVRGLEGELVMLQ